MTDANRIPDRIGEYLIPHLKEYIFDELSEGYLKKAGLDDILTGVPVPVRIGEVEGLTTLKIAQNMAFVIGCDVNFRHRDSYIAYITRLFTKDFVKPLINDGVDGAAKNDFDYACIMFRAALLHLCGREAPVCVDAQLFEDVLRGLHVLLHYID